MLSLYTVLLTLHIVFVVAWVGAGITQTVLARQLVGAGGANQAYAQQLEWFGAKWFPTASGLAGLAGIGLWIDGPWGLGEPWIIIAVAGWIASSVIGATQLGPGVAKWRANGAAADDPAWARVLLFARIDQAILILVIADMVMKPGL